MMSEEMNRRLQALADQKAAEQHANDVRPAVSDAADKQYAEIPKMIQQKVAEFNQAATAAKLTMRLEGPEWAHGETAYLLRLLPDGFAQPGGRVLVLEFGGFRGLDTPSFSTLFWDNHFNLRVYKAGGWVAAGGVPGEEPRRYNGEQYKAVQSGVSFGWVSGSSGQPMKIEDVIDGWFDQLVTYNT